MWSGWLISILLFGGLVSFVAMLIGVAWADRKAKRAIAEGREPGFSWAWFIFSIYLLAQGLDKFIQECIYDRHKDDGALAHLIWQGLAILLLAVGITAFTNHVRWLIYTRRNQG